MENEPEAPKEQTNPEVPSVKTKKYAGFWIRLLATIIDGIILSILGRILFGSETANMQDGTANVSFTGWQTLVPILYTIGFWGVLSTSPGKMLFGLKIVNEKGEKLSWKTAIIRYLGYIVSWITLGIGFLWIAFDKKKQGLHDKIAKTYVVKK